MKKRTEVYDIESGEKVVIDTSAHDGYGTLIDPEERNKKLASYHRASGLETAWSTIGTFAGSAGSALFPIFALAAYALIPTIPMASSIAGGAGAFGLISAFVKWYASEKPFNGTAKELGAQLDAIESFISNKNDMLRQAISKLETFDKDQDKKEFLYGYTQGLIDRLSKIKPSDLNTELFDKIIEEESLRVRDKIEIGFNITNSFLASVLIPGFWLLTANGFLHPQSNPLDPSTQVARKVWFDWMSGGLGLLFGSAGVAITIHSLRRTLQQRTEMMTHFHEQLNSIESKINDSEKLIQQIERTSINMEIITQRDSTIKENIKLGFNRFSLLASSHSSSDTISQSSLEP